MSRKVNLKLREQILKACVDAALDEGLGKITLARFSKMTGISRRMLIYHFGSVDRLIAETLWGAQNHIRNKLHDALVRNSQLDSRKAILTIWKHYISPQMERTIRAFFCIYLDAMDKGKPKCPFVTCMVPGWIAWAKEELSGHRPVLTDEDLTVVLSVLRGLLLDYWTTRDRARTTKALSYFLNHYVYSVEVRKA